MTGPSTSDEENLRDRVVEIIRSGDDSPTTWFQVWRLIAADPWYRSELRRFASISVRGSQAPPEWCDDVEQDVIILLARTLRHSPDLHAEVERLQFTFRSWMRTIIQRHCREAVKRRLAQAWDTRDLTRQPDRRRVIAELEARLDMATLCDRLPDPAGSIMLHWLNGYTLTDIAEKLDLPYITVCRDFQTAREILRQEISDD